MYIAYACMCADQLLQRKGKKKMTLTISKGGIRIVDDATKVNKTKFHLM